MNEERCPYLQDTPAIVEIDRHGQLDLIGQHKCSSPNLAGRVERALGKDFVGATVMVSGDRVRMVCEGYHESCIIFPEEEAMEE